MKSIFPVALVVIATGMVASSAVADQSQMMMQQQQMLQQQMQQQQAQQAQQAQQLQDQLQQQQLQQQQFQNQSLGLSGIQPYCSSYGTCPNPFPSEKARGPDLSTVLGGLFGGGAQPAQAAYPAEQTAKGTPDTAQHRRHYHRHAR